jgi:hypothetical protein
LTRAGGGSSGQGGEPPQHQEVGGDQTQDFALKKSSNDEFVFFFTFEVKDLFEKIALIVIFCTTYKCG